MTAEDPSTKSLSPSRTFEANKDTEAIEDDLFGNDHRNFHVSPRKDTYFELNFEHITILDVTVHASDVDIVGLAV